MLKKKISLIWLLLWMVLTSYLMISGLIFYNWKITRGLEKIDIPTKGIFKDAPGFLLNIEGEENKEFLNSPLGVVAGKDKVYITDSKNHRVNVYSKKGRFLFSFGEMGKKDGQFVYPNTLAIDDTGKVFVGEFQTGRIQVFDSSGKFQNSITSNNERDIIPLSITVKNKKIYMVSKSGEIVILTYEGNLIEKFGQPGVGKGQLNFPNGIAVSEDNRIFVSDSGNGRVQIFSDKGEFLQILDTNGNLLNLPRGIAFDELGNLYIVDIFSHSISVYDNRLNYLFSFGERGTKEGQVNFPNNVFIDGEFHIYITDRENNRVVVYQY